MSGQLPGGFMPSPNSLHSPTPSTFSTSSRGSHSSKPLPHPRAKPLRPNSSKEEAARRFVEDRLLRVSRRYAKKFQGVEEGGVEGLRERQLGSPGSGGSYGAVKGYTSMKEVAKDLDEVVDVLWLSGTPSLQIPHLLSIALSLSTYLPAFPPSPHATFSLFRKLDHAFASLLRGEDIDTGEILPGFESGRRNIVSRTDMVRIKSLVEGTRVEVVNLMSQEPEDEEDEEDGETGTEHENKPEEDEGEDDDELWDGKTSGSKIGKKEPESDVDMDGGYRIEEVEGENDMDVARVYMKTIIELNTALSNSTGYDAGDDG